MSVKKFITVVFHTAIIGMALVGMKPRKPFLWLIGDSTVDDGSGHNDLWGWGKFLPQFFDTTKITIQNYAQGGASARTFLTNGLWAKNINTRGMWDTVYLHLQSKDYLIIQFGLNDQSPVDDSIISRGTLKGIGDDSILIFNRVT